MANAILRTPSAVNEPVKSYAPGSLEKTELKSELAKQEADEVEIPLVINGERVRTSTRSFASPHKHRHVLAKCHQADAGVIAKAISGARQAQRDWARMPWEHRAAVFLKAADLLASKYRAEMNAATMLGQSKTVYQAEIDAACELIDFWRFNVRYMEELYREQPISSPGMWNQTVARGLEGFVFAVTPFNFTSIALNLPSAPALMGCSVVWKPAATSMLSSYVGMKILEEAGLPAGVINFVPGKSTDIGEAVLMSQDLAGIHFTGSTGVFNYFWETVGKNVSHYRGYPRVVGETGGKDFIFAHESADEDALVTAMIRGAFEYQGQKCSAASRAFIPQRVWGRIKDRLITETNDIKMGDPADFKNFMAAVIDKASFDNIKGYVDHARAASEAEIIAGGECDDSEGYFIRPTIIEAKSPTYRSMVEEIFGPVLSIYVYDESQLDMTLAACDQASPYALTGAVFAQDRHAVVKISQALENTAGNFYINDKPTGAVVGQQPFGGSRASGTNDKAGSKLNLMRWMSQRTIKETYVPPVDYRYPHMGES